MPELSSPSFLSLSSPKPSRILGRFSPDRGWFLNAGLALFALAMVTFGGLFFYQRSLGATRVKWLEQVKGQAAELERPEALAKLIDLSNSLAAVREVLANHVLTSNIFVLLENVTYPRVQFTTFGLSRDARKIDLAGSAPTYQAVAEQVRILESHPEIEQVNFGGLSLSERGLVNFTLTVIVNESLLRFHTP